MNIEVPNLNIPENPGSILDAMFAAQLRLYEKYAEIERNNGTWKPDLKLAPQDLSGRALQEWVKQMFWRVTEELAEMTELPVDLAGRWGQHYPADKRLVNFLDELSDALHFLIEVTAVLGCVRKQDIQHVFLKVQEIGLSQPAIDGARAVREFPDQCMSALGMRVFRITQAMGLAANCLKNRPWKQTEVPVDCELFSRRLLAVWARLAELCTFCELNLVNLYQVYHIKHATNVKRQKEGY